MKRFLSEGVRSRIRQLRRTLRRAQVRSQPRATRAELADEIRALGIESGDIVFLHSSLSAIGFVVGGADSVIDAFLEVLAPKGTLTMPSFPFDTYVEDYLSRTQEFDLVETPSRMGKITEVFRLRPGVVRSIHATHPVVALGPHANELVADHHRDPRTFGELSPFYRLCELDAHILLVGVDYHAMTNLHVVEDVSETFPYNVYRDEPFQIRVRGTGEAPRDIEFRAHPRALSSLRDCNKMEPHFDAAGVLTRGHLGQAAVRVLRAGGVLETMTQLAAKGITMYKDDAVPAAYRKAAVE